MKVVVSGYIGKKITGIGRNLISLLDNASGKNTYVVYTNFDMKDELVFNNPNVTVKTYDVSKMDSMKNLLWTTFTFPTMVKKEHADRALIPNFTLLLHKSCPTVVIMHDLIEFNIPNKFSKKKMFYRTKLADPITAKNADHIITVSENSKKDIIQFLKVPEDKITVVYDGVDTDKFCRMDKEQAESIIVAKGWPTDFLLYAGTIDHPGKNAMGVIKAFEKLKKIGKYHGSLILAGMPGANHEAVETYIEHSEYKKDIFLTGFVTDEELIALYSLCKVFVFISLYEGFGMPPLEALACGAKVVVSNTSSLPEVVGDVGYTTNPKNLKEVVYTIEQAMNSIVDEKYNERVKEHLTHYDWKNLSQQFESVMN